MKKILILIFWAGLSGIVEASCPSLKSAANFDVNNEKSNGRWYVTHSTDDVDCSSFETTSSDEPNSFKTIYYPYNLACISRFKNAEDITQGFIDDCDWNEKFHGTNGQIFIIDYDKYLGYAVCLNEGGNDFMYVSLASREKTMSDEDFETIKNYLKTNFDFDASTLKPIKHDSC